MPHADLRRDATAVIAKPASVPLYDSAVGYLVWMCGCVRRGGMSDAMGYKKHVQNFSN